MPPLRDEVRGILLAFYNPADRHYPTDRRVFSADPVYAVRHVAQATKLDWDANRTAVVASFLSHPANTRLMDLINNVAAAEQDVVSAIDAARPSFWLTIVAHTTLFCLGVGLLAFGVSGLWFGTDWLAVLFAAGGIGATFSVLLRAPVRGLQQSIATRIQLELIANGYRKEIAIWKSYAAFSDRQDDPLSVDSVVSSQIRRSAARALALIEAYCEPLGTSKIRYKRRWDRHLHRLAQVGPVSTNHYPFERPAIQPMPAGKIASDKRPEKTMTEKMMTEKMRPDKSPLEQIPRPLPEMEAPRTGPDEQPPGKIPFILAIPHEPPAGPPDR